MRDETIAGRLSNYFRTRPEGITCVYLFGSEARGDAIEGSDVDLGVLFAAPPPRTLAGSGLRLAGELERLLGRSVDVVVLNRAPVDLVHRVLRDGVLVHEGDRAARVEFEVRRRNEYFDLRPFLDRYRRATDPAHG